MILFVGQAPGRRALKKGRAFDGPGAGSRLAAMSGLARGEFLSRFKTTNVFRRWPGKKGKGDAFPLARAHRGAQRIMSSDAWREAEKVVFVGQGVVRAFLFHAPDLALRLIDRPCTMQTWAHGAKPRAYLPHPSGVNRWYNDPNNRFLAESFLRKLAKEVR